MYHVRHINTFLYSCGFIPTFVSKVRVETT